MGVFTVTKHGVLLYAVTVILFAMTAYAQSGSPSDPSLPPANSDSGLHWRQLPLAFANDEWQIWTSPFRGSTYRSHALPKYVIPFALISGALIATDKQTAALLPNTTDQTKWSGRVSELGASYTLAGFTGATLLLGQLTKNQHLRETGLLSLEAFGHTQIVVFGLKQITNRERPLDGDGGGGFWEGGNSFPSGHAATSFAVATVFAYEYRRHIAVPITAYALASLVSASRLSAQRHWVSDIFVGASAGFLIGRFVYKRHHDPALPGSSTSRLVPEINVAPSGVLLTWSW